MLEIRFRIFPDHLESFLSSMFWDGKERMDSRKWKNLISGLINYVRHTGIDSVAVDIYRNGDYIDTVYCFTSKHATRGEFRIMANGTYIRKGALY